MHAGMAKRKCEQLAADQLYVAVVLAVPPLAHHERNRHDHETIDCSEEEVGALTFNARYTTDACKTIREIEREVAIFVFW